jgi:ribosome-associated protein
MALPSDSSDDEGISKSAAKREAHRLRELGLQLAALKAEQLAQVPLSDELRRVLTEHGRITSHIARRRHGQLIGRLMRSIDVSAIESALAGLQRKNAESRFTHHLLEQWRARLLEEDAALTEFIGSYPRTDVQQLRRLLRQARINPRDSKPTRALFRLLREIIADHDQPVPPTVS